MQSECRWKIRFGTHLPPRLRQRDRTFAASRCEYKIVGRTFRLPCNNSLRRRRQNYLTWLSGLAPRLMRLRRQHDATLLQIDMPPTQDAASPRRQPVSAIRRMASATDHGFVAQFPCAPMSQKDAHRMSASSRIVSRVPLWPVLIPSQGLGFTPAQLNIARSRSIDIRAVPGPPVTRARPRFRVFTSFAVLPSRIALKARLISSC